MSERFHVRERAEIACADWDAFVDSSSQAWLWHRSELITALALWPGRTDASFAVCDDAGRILAVMPMHRTRARIARVMTVVRFNSLGGPACGDWLPSRQRADVLSTLDARIDTMMADEGALSCEAQLSPLTPSQRSAHPAAIDPLAAVGFTDDSTSTWMVDLEGTVDAIRRKYSSLTRRELRKAENSGLRIREADGSRDLDTYYRLHLETYGRTGARPLPISYFQAIFETCRPARFARILFAERGGAVVAAQNTALYKKGSVYWTGASATDKAGGENRILFDAQIVAARSDGCLLYETGEAFPDTADAKERGLSQFKRSFGARTEPYRRGTRASPNAVLRILWNLRSMIPRSVSALP